MTRFPSSAGVLVAFVISAATVTMVGNPQSRPTVYAFFAAVSFTVGRTILFFAIAFFLALGLAGLQALVRSKAKRAIANISGLRYLPAVAWLPLIALFTVASFWGRLTFVVLGLLPHLFVRLSEAFRSCPAERIFAVTHSAEADLRAMLHVVLPSSLKEVFDAMKFGVGLAFVLELIFEFIVPPKIGIGRLFNPLDVGNLQVETAVAYIVAVFVVGLSLESGAEILRRRLEAWQRARTSALPI